MSNTPQPTPKLTLGGLRSQKEKSYLIYVTIISIIVWLALVLSIVGVVYGILIGLFIWIGHGLFAAYLRAEAVRVDERQLPELYATFLEVCEKLEYTTPPKLYVLQAGGTLNAFATRFAGRDFVVIFSDTLEALGHNTPETKFILGHELGHLKSKHILKQTLLAPGLFFPLIGPAYRRAWETSCDRFGAFSAQSMEGSLRAMLTLSGGKEQGRILDAEAFASQREDERGFFVSLHELTSTYPTLSQRVRFLISIHTGHPIPRVNRSPFAYLFALLTPGGNLGSGGASGALVTVVMIGLLAAMAIPAFQKVRQSSIEKACHNNRRMISASLDQYVLENSAPPSSFDDIIGPDKYIQTMPICPSAGQYGAQPDVDGISYDVSCSLHGTGRPTPATAAQPY